MAAIEFVALALWAALCILSARFALAKRSLGSKERTGTTMLGAFILAVASGPVFRGVLVLCTAALVLSLLAVTRIAKKSL